MGINAFFTFTVILGKQVPWPVALGVVFWAGVIFVVDFGHARARESRARFPRTCGLRQLPASEFS